MKRSFCIVFSHLTAQLFAWSGTPKANKKYLGNREIIGTVQAASENEALTLWRESRAFGAT